MKKILMIVGLIVVLVIIGGVLFFFLGLNAAVRAGVEKGGSHFLKTEVTLQEVKLSPFNGTGTLSGLNIKNPEGFSVGNAFTLTQVYVNLDPRSLMSDKITINEVLIDGPVINYDQALTQSNIGQLKKNLESFTGPGKEKEEPATEPEEKGEGKQIALKHFVLENGQVHLSSKFVKGEGATLNLPRIELNDIGTGDENMSAGEVVNKVYSAVLAAVIKAVRESDVSLKEGEEVLKQLSEQAVGAEEFLKSMSGDAAGEAEDAADSVKEGIKGLLGGDEDKE